ncbi:MAG: type II toxin-antitoxin system MqsA family antitoxin [Armatimonadetes bacterium]|nr:type II toxin-antitoxin system MqsA family antitoxin [Anaerolineae bacterium]
MDNRTYPCEFCDTEQSQTKKLVTITRQRQGKWFIFEDVPAWVCPHCGHRYFDAEVVSAMEQRMQTPTEDARPIEALVMSLA